MSATPMGKPPEPQPDRIFMARIAARSTQIVGCILDGISAEYSLSQKPAAIIVRTGRLFWAVVEAAVPRSMANLLMHYWFSVLLIIEMVMIAGGTFISGEKAVQGLGIKLLALTLATRILIEVLRFYLAGQRVFRAILIFAVGLGIIFSWWGTIHFREVIVPGTESWVCQHLGLGNCNAKQETATTPAH
jgi:hypothetical protein